MTIETRRLTLRPWRETDAAALFKYASHPDVGPAAGWPCHPTEEFSRQIILTVFSAPETYAVVLKGIDEAIGCCGIVPGEEGEGEIGYWIGKPFWGQGLIPEAVNALLDRAFNELKLDTVWCAFYDENNKSRRVAEKCGFVYHHTNPAVSTLLGDTRTEHFTRLSKTDYLAARAVPDSKSKKIMARRLGFEAEKP